MDLPAIFTFVDDFLAPSPSQTRSISPNRWDGIVCRTGRLCPLEKKSELPDLSAISKYTEEPSDRPKAAFELMKAGLQAPSATKTHDRWQHPVLSTPKRMGHTSLRPHQKHAVNFMLDIWRKGMNPLLAHGMGLGKTVEIIGMFWKLVQCSILRP